MTVTFPVRDDSDWDTKLLAWWTDQLDQINAAIGGGGGGGGGDMFGAHNLSELTDVALARDTLQLGNAATADFGVDPGTIAAGDDPRIVGALLISNALAELVPTAAEARANLDVYSTGEVDSIAKLGVAYILVGNDASPSLKALANAVADGTGAGDAAALATAFALAGTRPLWLYGSFHPNAALDISAIDGTAIVGDCTIYSSDSAYPTPFLHIHGSRTQITLTTPQTGPLAQGTNVLTAATVGAGLVAGDWVALTTTQGWSTRPGENFYGETLQVETVTGTTVTFKTPFRQTYLLGAAGYTISLYRYNYIKNLQIEGVRVVGPGGVGHPTGTGTQRERLFVISYANKPQVRRCYVEAPYAREGLALYECRLPDVELESVDVNDLNGTSGVYEGYGLRFQGCEGGRGKVVGRGSRHLAEVNGGGQSYGLSGSQTRPISYDIELDVDCVKSWAAAAGDHPGAVGTYFKRVVADGCSGAIFIRGKNARVNAWDLHMYGGTHEQGPYTANQGNDHCITVGEQQRDAGGAADNTTRDGWCGSGLVIVGGLTHDMTGNGGTLGSTSHTIHAVHPLVNATIDLRGGIVKPTGHGVNAVGQYNSDVTIRGTFDFNAAFSGGGRAVNLAPAATSPTVATGQYNEHITVDVVAIKPRNSPVLIAGSADTAARSDHLDIALIVRTRGSGLANTDPAIVLGANPNAGTGYFGNVRTHDLVLPDFIGTTVDQSSASITSLYDLKASVLAVDSLTMGGRPTWLRPQNQYVLRHFNGLLPQAQTVPIKLFFDADSIGEGTNTTSIHERWINQLKDQLSAAVGCDGTSFGYLPALYSGVAGNPAWQTTIVTGDAGTLNANGPGRRSWLSASGATNQRTWHSIPVDRLAILYSKGSNRGKLKLLIDGVQVATIDTWQAGAGPTAAMWDSVTNGAITITPGVHDIQIATDNTGTGATYACDVAGIFPYWKNHDAGFQLWEGAHSALPSLQFSAIELAFLTLIDPDLVFHCKGVNDSAFSITPANTAATLAANVASVNGLGIGDVSHMFFAAWGNAGSQTPSQWLPYHNAIYTAALGVAAFVDQGESLGWPATDATAISDSIAHPNVKGGDATASIVTDALGVPPIGRSRNGWQARLPGRGFSTFREVGGFAISGVGIQGDVQERAYLSGLGGVGWSDGTSATGPLALYSAGALSIKAGAVYTPTQLALRQPVPTVRTTSFTTALTDAGVPIKIGSVSATTVTIPPNASVAYGIGDTLDITSTNSGVVTIAAGAGVTINNQSNYGLGLNLSGSRIVLRQDAIDSWTVIYANDLVAYTISERATAALLANKTINEAKGADIASATTTDIGAATGNYVHVTGTTTITGLGTVQAGTRRIVKFTGALILTHNATSLILPGSANITTVAGDTAMFVSLGSGNWICVAYQPVTVTGTGSTVLAASPSITGTMLAAAITLSGTLTLQDGGTVGTGGTTGTIFGGTFEKLSFFGKTPPITTPAAATDLGVVLSNLGLRTAGTAYPITTSGAVTMSGTNSLGATTHTGDLTMSTHNIVTDTTTGTKFGTATNQKIGFFNATPIVQGTAFTQTYATATHTHANITATNPPAGGTGATAGAYDTSAHRDAMITALTANIADVANVKQVLNALIDDLQALGLIA